VALTINDPSASGMQDRFDDVRRSDLAVDLRLTASPRTAAWDALWRKLFSEVLLEHAPGATTEAGEAREAA